jgi:hypothetical protein
LTVLGQHHDNGATVIHSDGDSGGDPSIRSIQRALCHCKADSNVVFDVCMSANDYQVVINKFCVSANALDYQVVIKRTNMSHNYEIHDHYTLYSKSTGVDQPGAVVMANRGAVVMATRHCRTS